MRHGVKTVSYTHLDVYKRQDFAWTISAGILIGTYSSIFIASPAALFFSRKQGLHEEVRQAMKEVYKRQG